MAIGEPDRFTHVILEALHVDREKPRSRAFFTMMAEAPDDFGPRVTEKLAAEHGDTWRMPIQADGRVWLELATTPGTLFDVHALRSPTLVITGENDPRREPGELAAFGDRVVVIPGGAHAPHSERVVAARTASVASHFLQR